MNRRTKYLLVLLAVLVVGVFVFASMTTTIISADKTQDKEGLAVSSVVNAPQEGVAVKAKCPYEHGSAECEKAHQDGTCKCDGDCGNCDENCGNCDEDCGNCDEDCGNCDGHRGKCGKMYPDKIEKKGPGCGSDCGGCGK